MGFALAGSIRFANADPNSYRYIYTYRKSDSDINSNTYANGDPNLNSHTDANPDSNPDSRGDA